MFCESLFQIAASVGFDLGCSLLMVEHTLDLLKSQEQARVNMFLESRKKQGTDS